MSGRAPSTGRSTARPPEPAATVAAPTLTFLGTGNAFSSGGLGNQALLLSTSDGRRWLIDCGPTTVLQLHRFRVDPQTISGVLLTHLHADHALGMPMLLLGLRFLYPPTRPFPVVGPPGTERYLQQLWRLAYPDVVRRKATFSLAVRELDGEARQRCSADGLRITSLPMRHSVPVNAYRIAFDGRLLAVSGDTGPAGDLEALGRGAGTLVVECNSLEPLPRVTHMSAADHRGRLPYGAQRVAFVHTGPDVQAARRRLTRELGVEIPADGDVWTL